MLDNDPISGVPKERREWLLQPASRADVLLAQAQMLDVTLELTSALLRLIDQNPQEALDQAEAAVARMDAMHTRLLESLGRSVDD